MSITLEAVRLSNGTLIACHPFLPAGHAPVWLPQWGVKAVLPGLYAVAKKRLGAVEVSPPPPVYEPVDWEGASRLLKMLVRRPVGP